MTDKPIFDFEAVFEPDDYLYFYESVLTEDKTKRQIDFLVKELELNKPVRILDLACGHGRHANLLAKLGHSVTGVDITSSFLEIAKKNAKQRGVNVKYIHEDMRKISFTEEFDRVISLFTSFGYFEDEENFKVLRNAARALKPGGLFCLDITNHDVILSHFLPYTIKEKGDDLMIDRNTFDSVTGRMYTKRIVIRDGKRKDKPFFIRHYTPGEIRDLLSKAGFGIYKMYGDWNANPITSDSGRMIIIAKKEK
ncbi:class I SAM-dependent methyltransferase [bacterium]|nr:class I SAM-dependent methyltransferase [bacterium]